MKKRITALLLAVLLLALCAPSTCAADSGVIFVAVNDTLPFELDGATMPFWATSGRLYVPYTVFENDALGIYISYSRTNQTLTLFNSINSVFFYMNYLRVEDQQGNEYLEPAKNINGVVYVSVGLICDIFHLTCEYSTLSGCELVRITNGSQTYSIDRFVEHAKPLADMKLESYLGSESYPQEEPEDSPFPYEPTLPDIPPPVEYPQPEPPKLTNRSIALWLEVGPDDMEEISAVLDILGAKGVASVIFFTPDAQPSGDLLRRAYASGHRLGFYAESPAALNERAEALMQAAHAATRYVVCENESVERLGYISCGWDADASEYYGKTPASLVSALPEFKTSILRFDMTPDGLTLLEALLYLDDEMISIDFVAVREQMFIQA